MASFGDVYSICQQINNLITLMKESPAELQEARSELVTLQTAFEFLRADLDDPASILRTHQDSKGSLDKVFHDCSGTLNNLKVIVEKYADVKPKKFSFHTMKFGATDVNKCNIIKANLQLHMQSISLLINQCQSEALHSLDKAQNDRDAMIMAKLEQLQSALANDTIPQASGNVDNVLCPVCSEIVNFKLSPNHMASHNTETRADMSKAMTAAH